MTGNQRQQINSRLDDTTAAQLSAIVEEDAKECEETGHEPMTKSEILIRAIKESYAIHVEHNFSNAYMNLIENQLNVVVASVVRAENAKLLQQINEESYHIAQHFDQQMAIVHTALRVMLQSFKNFNNPDEVQTNCELYSDSWSVIEQFVEQELEGENNNGHK